MNLPKKYYNRELHSNLNIVWFQHLKSKFHDKLKKRNLASDNYCLFDLFLSQILFTDKLSRDDI